MDLLEQTHLVEEAERRGWRDIFNAAPDGFRAGTGLHAEELGGATLFIAQRVPGIMFNRVVGLGLHEPITPTLLDAIVERYAAAGVPKYAIQLPPAYITSEIEEALEARGLHRRDNWVKMIRGLEPPPVIQTDLRVTLITPEEAGGFALAGAAGFGMPEGMHPWLAATVGRPGWRHYLAYENDRPVASGALLVQEGIGWLGIGGTHPDYRRRGAQGALMSRRILDATALGCTSIVTETGEETSERPNPSYRNMVRTGFMLAHARRNYITG